jgi:hypothetical protein
MAVCSVSECADNMIIEAHTAGWRVGTKTIPRKRAMAPHGVKGREYKEVLCLGAKVSRDVTP